MDDEHALGLLRARGADRGALEKIAGSGLSAAVALRASGNTGLLGWLRRRLFSAAALSAAERTRLHVIAELAADVADMEGDADNARRFWDGPMPWLGGRSPAQTLIRRDGPGVIEDLVVRIKYGIPP